jgi:hypothetical protein
MIPPPMFDHGRAEGSDLEEGAVASSRGGTFSLSRRTEAISLENALTGGREPGFGCLAERDARHAGEFGFAIGF